MVTRIALVAFLIAAGSSLAAAQGSIPAAKPSAPPMTSAPASNTTMPNGDPKWQAPPAANSGDTGLKIGPGSADGTPLEVKRNK